MISPAPKVFAVVLFPGRTSGEAPGHQETKWVKGRTHIYFQIRDRPYVTHRAQTELVLGKVKKTTTNN